MASWDQIWCNHNQAAGQCWQSGCCPRRYFKISEPMPHLTDTKAYSTGQTEGGQRSQRFIKCYLMIFFPLFSAWFFSCFVADAGPFDVFQGICLHGSFRARHFEKNLLVATDSTGTNSIPPSVLQKAGFLRGQWFDMPFSLKIKVSNQRHYFKLRVYA